MSAAFIRFILLLLLVTEQEFVLSSLDINQSPRHLLTARDLGNVTLHCRHGDSDYPYVFWFQHRTVQGTGRHMVMVMVGRIYHNTAQMELGFNARFGITGDAKADVNLTISQVHQSDTAQYFCAASMHGVLDCVTFKTSHPIILQENTRAEIKCQHDDDALSVMLWYQRRPENNTLSLIGYSYFGNKPNYEKEFKDQFELTRESELKGALVLRKAEANDSGEYFCAGSTR
ncbi:unnamed protein product [Boreogadus saida]